MLISCDNIPVLADESMHGMKNAVETIKKIDDVAPFPDVKMSDEGNRYNIQNLISFSGFPSC